MADGPAPSPAPWSLRRRLTGALIGACVAIGLLALWDTRGEALRTARDISDRVLAGSAMAIAEQITLDSGGTLSVAIPFSALDMLSSAAQDQVFYRVDGPTGFLTGYDGLPPVPPTVPPTGADTSFADDTWRGTAIRKATLRRELSGGGAILPVAITVAESTRAREELAAGILSRSALRIAILIGGATLVALAVVTLALRPLNDLSRQMTDRRPDDLHPVASAAVAELQPVVQALNGFLSRLKEAVAALQSFSGNANHQIRTPITVARTQIGLARRATDAPARDAALQEADLALIRTEQVLAQLLRLARLQSSGAALSTAPFDLARRLRSLTADHIPAALTAGIDLGFDGPETLRVASDEVLLAELVGNLIDNAVRHGVSGAAVTVSLGRTGGRPRITVASDGPPPDRARLARIEEALSAPGSPLMARATEHGLGLHLVREIAGALGITLQAGLDTGGLAISATLPDQTDSAA